MISGAWPRLNCNRIEFFKANLRMKFQIKLYIIIHDYIRKLQGTSINFVIFKNEVCRKSTHESYRKGGILIGQRDRGNISKTFCCKEKRIVFYLIFINHIDRTKQPYALPSIPIR